jgi:hypothetical protein
LHYVRQQHNYKKQHEMVSHGTTHLFTDQRGGVVARAPPLCRLCAAHLREESMEWKQQGE